MFASTGWAENKALYENDFEKAEAGKVPEEFLILDGQFTVKEENGNKFLELPGAPLDTYGVLFGPTENADVSVSARIFGTGKGRRFPAFGVGLNGVGGYRLVVSPAKKLLELYKGDEAVKTIPHEWKSGEWTELRLQIRKNVNGSFKVEGKVWSKGGTEPKDWMISFDETTEPAKGRPSIWGTPFSGNVIQFDDLAVNRL